MNVRELFDSAYAALGLCTKGPAAGAYLGVFPVASEDGSISWDAALSAPVQSEGLFQGDVFELDPERSEHTALLAEWGVVQVPEPAASRGLYSLFPALLVSSAPRFPPGVSGRLANGRALSVAMSTLLRTEGDLSESEITVRNDDLPSALHGAEALIDQVSAVLAAHQYSLAIVPLRANIAKGQDEPWEEFDC